VTDPSQLSIVAGTFSINSTLHADPRMSTPPFLQTAYPVGTQYLATEGAATSASNLEWFCKQVLEAEGVRAEGAGRTVYDVTNDLVAGALDRPNDILFFPFLFGGPSGAPAGFLGLTAGHSLADVLRAIYEGIAFAHRQDIGILLSGPDAARPTSIRLAGGASRSAVWAQIFADVLGMPVETMQGSELGAQGVAICAATAIGAYPEIGTAIGAMTRTTRRFTPNPARVETLASKFSRYAAVVSALGPVWAGSSTGGVTARAA
jgi:L-xylulokinase